MILQKFYQFASVALISVLAFPSFAEALTVAGNTVGQIREDTHIVDQKCLWDETKKGEAIYSVGENEVIIGIEKIDSSLWQGGGYDTDKTPPKYNYSSYSKVVGDYEYLINAEGSSGGNEEYKARLEQELKSLQEATSKLQTSHSTFVIDWRCKGSGNFFDRMRGKVYAHYKVRVMYLPSPQAIQVHLALMTVPRPTSELGDGTILHFNFPGTGTAYLNLCSPEYQLSSGMCETINLQNSRLERRSGYITIDYEHLGRGDDAWLVFVDDRDSSPQHRYLYYRRITGGKEYRFGTEYDGSVPR